MPVCPLVDLLQVFCIIKELLPQPFRRRIQITALMPQGIGSWLVDILICPVTDTDRRVEALKHNELLPAAENRLLNGTDFLHPGELVQLLKPEILKIPVAGFQ